MSHSKVNSRSVGKLRDFDLSLNEIILNSLPNSPCNEQDFDFGDHLNGSSNHRRIPTLHQPQKLDGAQSTNITPLHEQEDPVQLSLNWEAIKHHKKVIAYCILISLAGFNFGYDTGIIGGICQMSSFVQRFGSALPKNSNGINNKELKSWVKGLIVSIYHIGCIFGGFTIARLSEFCGRKIPIVISLGTYITGILIQITAKFSSSWVQFMIGRFVNGVAIGSLGCLGPMFLSETSPTEIRGFVTCFYQLNIVSGLLVGAIVVFGTKSSYTGSNNAGDMSWIVPLLVCIAVALCGFAGVCYVPESSRYLVSKGKYEAAKKSLIQIGDLHYKRTLNLLISKTKFEENSKNVSFFQMFKDKHNLKKIIVGVSIMWLQQMNGIDYFFYYGVSLFESAGIDDSYVTSIILATVNVISTFPGLVIIERFGRRSTLLFGAFFCTCFLVVYATIGSTLIHLNPQDDSVNKVPGTIMIVFTCCFIMAYGVTWGPVGQVLVSELYPIQIKAKAIALSTAFNWAANFFIAFCTPVISEKIHYKYGFVFAGCAFSSFWFILFMVPETKGISLEEIDGLFNEKESLGSNNLETD